MVIWSDFIQKLEAWNYYLIISSLLFGIGQLIQALEYFKIRDTWGPHGVWTPELISTEWSNASLSWWERPLRFLFFRYPEFWYQGFYLILTVKAIAAISLFIQPTFTACLLLLLTLVYTNLRWRGTYNGGSDMMSLVVSMGLTWTWFFVEHPTYEHSSTLSKVGLYYIGIQSVISYFIAGLIKIKRPQWRSGEALKKFLNVSVFTDSHRHLEILRHKSVLIKGLGWVTLFFEIAFPLALLNAPTALVFITWAALFHLTNVYVFGLNRFFWAWAATWPCILIISLH